MLRRSVRFALLLLMGVVLGELFFSPGVSRAERLTLAGSSTIQPEQTVDTPPRCVTVIRTHAGVAQLARACACQAQGRRFDPGHPLS